MAVWPWPTIVTFIPSPAKVKLHVKHEGYRPNGSNRRAHTDKQTQTDRCYQAHYLPAFCSSNDIVQLKHDSTVAQVSHFCGSEKWRNLHENNAAKYFFCHKNQDGTICEHYSAHNIWNVYLASIKISWNENSITFDKCKDMAWKWYAYSKHHLMKVEHQLPYLWFWWVVLVASPTHL